MIKNTEHCVLCEHSKKDFKTGTYCGLTNEKPTFKDKCENKTFGEKMQQKIFEVDYKLKMARDRKSATMLHLYTYLGFSLIAFGTDYFLVDYLYGLNYNHYRNRSSYYLVATPIVIFAIATYLIPMAVAPLNKYKRTLSLAKESKVVLDEILNSYNIRYNIETKLSKKIHDSIDVEASLTLVTEGIEESFQLKKMNIGTTND